jgi:hypothetical protein
MNSVVLAWTRHERNCTLSGEKLDRRTGSGHRTVMTLDVNPAAIMPAPVKIDPEAAWSEDGAAKLEAGSRCTVAL